MANITLVPLAPDDRNQFILDNQEAFNYGALEEFGRRDDHFEEEGEIISRETIEKSIDGGEAYRIMQDGQPVGGVVIRVEGAWGESRSSVCLSKSAQQGHRLCRLVRGGTTASGSNGMGNGHALL